MSALPARCLGLRTPHRVTARYGWNMLKLPRVLGPFVELRIPNALVGGIESLARMYVNQRDTSANSEKVLLEYRQTGYYDTLKMRGMEQS